MQRLSRDVGLVLLAVCCGLVVAFVPMNSIRALAAVLLVLVLPGAAFARALFGEEESRPERLLLTLGLSAPLVAIAALIIDTAGVPLDRRAWAIAAVVVVTACSAFAFTRRRPTTRAARASASPDAFDVIVILIAIEVIVGAVGLSLLPLKAPAGTPGYTALWLQPSRARSATAVVSSAQLEWATFRLVTATNGTVRTRRTFQLPPGGRRRFHVPVTGSASRVVAVLHRLDAKAPVQRVELLLPSRRATAGAVQ
jgi:Protein of unknown function (DUF1616)